jgi:crotonobetainyl-CoA:carnitine CoA-transferase CaiB-like acyl-CoA transferase
MKFVGLPVSFDGTRPAIRSRPPSLGEHNAQIFKTKEQ